MSAVDAVLIGRNEGARLVAALASVEGRARRVVYVDFGSTDGSVAAAEAAGAQVVNLDLSTPFTAARARNAGFERLEQDGGAADYVQFVDGDCVLQSGWIETGRVFLDVHADVAVVQGQVRERHPEASIYNRLCDMEWQKPPGEVRACGGIAMMRAVAFRAVGGFDPELIAGEEPELCVRLRAAGWRIWSLSDEMVLHDAEMTRFSQYWTRARRSGHTYAEAAAMHGAPPERHGVAGRNRALVWGLALPAAILFLALAVHPAFLLLALVYPGQVARLALTKGPPGRQGWLRALFLTVAKFPQAQGVLQYLLGQLRGRRAGLIEYK